MERTCRKCGQTKPIQDFHKHPKSAGGHLQRCIACVTAAWREKRKVDPAVLERERQYWSERVEQKRAKDIRYISKDPERNRQRVRDWAAADPERAKDSSRRYYLAHREERIAYQRERVASADPATLREKKRAYYQRNRDHLLEQAKVRRQLNPGQANSGSRRRKAQKRSVGQLLGFHSEEQWRAKLAEYDGRCAHCGTTDRITRDHIVPLAKGGADTIDNIQPLCYACNSRKSARLEGDGDSEPTD